jgi:hypothetical protein
MSKYENVKYKLRDYIIKNVSEMLTAEKVFYATERFTMPEKPYLMITELSNNEDLRSGYEYNGLVKEITEYKETIFTVAIYGLSENDLSEDHDKFRAEIKNIRNAFKKAMFSHELKKDFTIQSITDLRPLSETNDTGFTYRYEFDIRCGYNEIITHEFKESQGVIIDLEENDVHIETNKENLDV